MPNTVARNGDANATRPRPLAVWDAHFATLAKEVEASGLGRVAFASPFRATVFGTDTYTDQLW